MALKLFARKKPAEASAGKRNAPPTAARRPQRATSAAARFVPSIREPLDPDPIKRLFQQDRFCVLLARRDRSQRDSLSHAVFDQAAQALEESMALVPTGSVSLSQSLTAQPGAEEEEINVDSFLFDMHAVSNVRFQRFVDAGGYDELDCWPEDMWPHLIELRDLTGQPGPRFWRDGRHDARLAEHPVVGVSWYEARAYAAWIGQRLPTEAEWQMASSWHIDSAADLLRRFPWGDAMDNTKCNIWSSRMSATLPVSSYPEGAAPNQVRQLIGNVWEWCDAEYTICDDEGRPVIAEMPMQVIRGGAFDTYFETQATSQFRTGQMTLCRAPNLGFRCAMDLDQAFWLDQG